MLVLPAHLRVHRTVLLLLGPLLFSSCSAPGPSPLSGEPSAAKPRTRPSLPPPTPATMPALPEGEELGPSILVPDPASADDEVDRVGTRAIRKHDVYDRFVELDPLHAAEVRELVALDLLVAEEAAGAGIIVRRGEVEAVVEADLALFKRKFETELASRMSFGEFLAKTSGLDEDGYRTRAFRIVARRLLRERTVRFVSWQRERVSCRFLVTSDERLAQQLQKKVVEGADLEVLARKHSEDETRNIGGKLPPFPPDFAHPVAEIAFSLREGECSTVVVRKEGDRTRHFVVQCLRRLPARSGSYRELEKEIVADLETNPMTPFESTAFYVAKRRPTVAPAAENR